MVNFVKVMQRELEKIEKNASTIAEHPSLPAAAKERLRNDVKVLWCSVVQRGVKVGVYSCVL